MPRCLTPISIGFLALFLVASGSSAAELLQASAGENGLFAVQFGDQIRVGRVGEETIPIEAPRGADIYSLRSTVDGWVAGGSVPNDTGQLDLLLVQHVSDRLERLPNPDRGPAKLRGQPVVLVGSGRLVGLAWVEGDRQSDLQVWAASWNGNGWGDREAVSRPGPGSQLALAGAVLEDQSWLLVWTRFDGEDDETVSSTRAGGVWSTVERVHEDNQVPDITPALVALENGALAAWSWFDGSDYRLRTARFDGQKWLVNEPIGDKGSLYPSLVLTERGAQLLFQTVAPETWTVIEVDGTGEISRTASLPKRGPSRPLLVGPIADEVRLVWISEVGKIDDSTLRSQPWETLE